MSGCGRVASPSRSHFDTVREATPRCSANARTLNRSAPRSARASRPVHRRTIGTGTLLSSSYANTIRAARASDVRRKCYRRSLPGFRSSRMLSGMEPITEQRQVPGPVVYGYLRMAAPSRARRAALSRALAAYCDQHELVLAAVFTDSGDDRMRAPGFAGLLDAITATASYGVVMPTRAHLGSGQAAGQRSAAIAGAGMRLMLVHDALVGAATGRAR